MLWTELCSPKLICWSPKPNVTVSGNKVCRWWFRLSEVISPNLIGLWPLKKRKRARSLSAMWGHSGKVTICSSSKELSPDTEPVGTLILDLLSPELCENRWQLFKPPRLYDFVTAVRADWNRTTQIIYFFLSDLWEMVSFKEFVCFIQVVKYIGKKLFIVFLYPFNVYNLCGGLPSLIPYNWPFASSHFLDQSS